MNRILDNRSNFIKFLCFIFLLNLLDMVLTVWQMNLYGLDVEKNLFIKMIVERFGYEFSIIFKGVVGGLICIYLYKRYNVDLYKFSHKIKKRTTIILWIIAIVYGLINLLHVFNLSLYAYFYYIY